MRDFIADVRAEYASMAPRDWANWALTLGITLALLVYITSQSI